MSEVTKEGANRFSEEEKAEKNRMEDRKSTDTPDSIEMTYI